MSEATITFFFFFLGNYNQMRPNSALQNYDVSRLCPLSRTARKRRWRRKQPQLDCGTDIRIQCRFALGADQILAFLDLLAPALGRPEILEGVGCVLAGHCPRLQKLMLQDNYFEERSLAHLPIPLQPWLVALGHGDSKIRLRHLDDHFVLLLW